jgi:hypothetical protein
MRKCSILESNFSGMSKELFKSELKNQDRLPEGKRYSDEVKKFAMTLHFYSPRGYEFVRTILSLPAASSIANWTSTVDCDPGFFLDVFQHLKVKAETDTKYRDCALIFDGMHIKSGVVYNKTNGNYEGFVNYGSDIVPGNQDKVATEAYVFMLVGLQGHWKCPIGYVLCSGISSVNLHALVSKCLRLCAQHGLLLHSVTCDGSGTNFDCMKSFGCQFGPEISNVKSEFSVPDFEHQLYFLPDACHMLKLARNALADLKELKDIDGLSIKWEHITALH